MLLLRLEIPNGIVVVEKLDQKKAERSSGVLGLCEKHGCICTRVVCRLSSIERLSTVWRIEEEKV